MSEEIITIGLVVLMSVGTAMIITGIAIIIEYWFDVRMNKKRQERLDKLAQVSQDMGMYD